jgi:hypothetical protein
VVDVGEGTDVWVGAVGLAAAPPSVDPLQPAPTTKSKRPKAVVICFMPQDYAGHVAQV